MRISRERSAWRVMIRRCTEPKFRDWKHYGGKGIKVCPEWLGSFRQFMADMGAAPTPEHWLGRLDVTGDYRPGNCRWTLRKQQQSRKQHHGSNHLTHRGETMPLPAWAKRTGIPRGLISKRLKRRWTVAQALSPQRRRLQKSPGSLASL